MEKGRKNMAEKKTPSKKKATVPRRGNPPSERIRGGDDGSSSSSSSVATVTQTGIADGQGASERLYSEARAELLKRQLSNSENYDKAILTLSTAFLGLSIAFVKDIVPPSQACYLCLLWGSWILLVFSVASTIVSFLVSQKAIEEQFEKAERYYRENDPTALDRGLLAKATDWLNRLSGVLFLLGILFTVLFVSANL